MQKRQQEKQRQTVAPGRALSLDELFSQIQDQMQADGNHGHGDEGSTDDDPENCLGRGLEIGNVEGHPALEQNDRNAERDGRRCDFRNLVRAQDM